MDSCRYQFRSSRRYQCPGFLGGPQR